MESQRERLGRLVGRKDLCVMKMVARLALGAGSGRKDVIEEYSRKHYEKRVMRRVFQGLKVRLGKLKRRKEKNKFKAEMNELASKYQNDVDEMEDELEYLKDENRKLMADREKMVNNLKNALELGFDILNNSEIQEKSVENKSHKMYTPEPVTGKTRYQNNKRKFRW